MKALYRQIQLRRNSEALGRRQLTFLGDHIPAHRQILVCCVLLNQDSHIWVRSTADPTSRNEMCEIQDWIGCFKDYQPLLRMSTSSFGSLSPAVAIGHTELRLAFSFTAQHVCRYAQDSLRSTLLLEVCIEAPAVLPCARPSARFQLPSECPRMRVSG